MSWLKWIRGIFLGRDFLRSGSFWIPAVLGVLLVGVALTWMFWDRLNTGTEIRTETLGSGVTTVITKAIESPGTTLRNVGLIMGGIVAVLLAMWRSLVAERQANAALQQAKATFLQAETAERQSNTTLRSFLTERYEQGARKLGSDDPTVRLDGIDALERPAREHPPEYHVQVMKWLSLYIRTPGNAPQLREEVQAAMAAIGSRSGDDIKLENKETFKLDLIGADLRNMSLIGANLSNSRLYNANLKDALLHDANLSGTEFSLGEGHYPAIGLTQAQLSRACS